MIRTIFFVDKSTPLIILILICLGVAFVVGMFIGLGELELVERQIQLIVLIGLSLFILTRPYFGVILIISSLPIIDIIPSIPYLGSVITLLGGITLCSFFLNKYLTHRERKLFFPTELFIGFLFVVWIFISNPSASLLVGNNDRFWFFTFAQLLLLAWLAAQLLDTPQKHYTLMWVFSIVTILSSIFAIQQGVLETTINSSVRASGLAGGANSAARYFIVGLIFIYYLIGRTKNLIFKAVLYAGMLIIIFGTIKTVSRTGLLLLCGTVGMILLLRIERKNKIRSILLLIALLSVVWFFSDVLIDIFRSIFPSIKQGTDTIGLRYRLWEAGIRMFKENIIRGVGIGKYTANLVFFSSDLLPYYRFNLGAHNMYIQVLAETGLVGITIFLSFLGSSNLAFLRGVQLQRLEISSLAKTWLVVFFVLLLGGVTKHDHYDKLLWMIAGISMCTLWNPTNVINKKSTG